MLSSSPFTRAEFLKYVSLAALATGARPARILKATLGERIPLQASNGDVWTSAWADDDNLYAASDDSTGFGKACHNNLVVSRISGTPPDLHGVSVN